VLKRPPGAGEIILNKEITLIERKSREFGTRRALPPGKARSSHSYQCCNSPVYIAVYFLDTDCTYPYRVHWNSRLSPDSAAHIPDRCHGCRKDNILDDFDKAGELQGLSVLPPPNRRGQLCPRALSGHRRAQRFLTRRHVRHGAPTSWRQSHSVGKFVETNEATAGEPLPIFLFASGFQPHVGVVLH
jgi:hypothetical protein